jgi:hypothetical protein
MWKKLQPSCLMVSVMMAVSVVAMSQGQLTLLVSGRSTSIPLMQMNGRNYVQVEALARAVNGSLQFNGNQTTLTVPAAGGNASATAPAATTANSAANGGFSQAFLRAGIEEMSTIREWRSALASVIENEYPFTQDWLTQYQAQANTNLRLAQAAATTSADQNASSLITNEYQKMKQLSDKYLAKRANMIYIPSNALTNDPLAQSIIACGKSLGAMVASGQFVDDGTCD